MTLVTGNWKAQLTAANRNFESCSSAKCIKRVSVEFSLSFTGTELLEYELRKIDGLGLNLLTRLYLSGLILLSERKLLALPWLFSPCARSLSSPFVGYEQAVKGLIQFYVSHPLHFLIVMEVVYWYGYFDKNRRCVLTRHFEFWIYWALCFFNVMFYLFIYFVFIIIIFIIIYLFIIIFEGGLSHIKYKLYIIVIINLLWIWFFIQWHRLKQKNTRWWLVYVVS